jgi:hypothetical protein
VLLLAHYGLGQSEIELVLIADSDQQSLHLIPHACPVASAIVWQQIAVLQRPIERIERDCRRVLLGRVVALHSLFHHCLSLLVAPVQAGECRHEHCEAARCRAAVIFPRWWRL